jgi:hypothetical protein
MASPQKHWRRFLAAVKRAKPGDRFEVGIGWQKMRGWQPYQKIAGAMLFMTPDHARAMVALFEQHKTEPQWKGPAESLQEVFDMLADAADDCDQKNRAREVPQRVAVVLPAEGNA